MLAYAPRRGRSVSRRTLVLVAAGHVGLIALVLTARSEMPIGRIFGPTEVIFVDPPKPPPPEPAPPHSPTSSTIDRPVTIIPTPRPTPTPLDEGPPVAPPTPFAGNSVEPAPLYLPTPPVVVRKAARFITAADDVRPPYPAAKQRMEEEASLRLALQIDSAGRVTSVDPVGAADPIFLDAARRHILKRWRYAPATEGDTAIASRIVITLRFELQ